MISEVPKSNRIHIEKGQNKSPEIFNADFIRILLKTPYEKEAERIFKKLTVIKNGDAKILEEERRKRKLERAIELKSIAESLLICKNGGITELKGKAYTTKPTSNTSKLIESKLEEEYKTANLHYEHMTFDEGKNILENRLCEDVEDFIRNYWIEWANEVGLSKEEIASGGYNIDNDLIEYYIEGQELAKEITIKQIESKIKELDEEIKANKKKGAPKKNLKLHCAILVFQESGLCKGKAQDLKTIYECLDYMGFIDTQLKEGWEKKGTYQAEISFIKSVYREAEKYRFKFYSIR